jgi:hypothetical protein
LSPTADHAIPNQRVVGSTPARRAVSCRVSGHTHRVSHDIRITSGDLRRRPCPRPVWSSPPSSSRVARHRRRTNPRPNPHPAAHPRPRDRVINEHTGELLRELTLDPTRDYQPLGHRPDPNKQKPRTDEGSGRCRCLETSQCATRRPAGLACGERAQLPRRASGVAQAQVDECRERWIDDGPGVVEPEHGAGSVTSRGPALTPHGMSLHGWCSPHAG